MVTINDFDEDLRPAVQYHHTDDERDDCWWMDDGFDDAEMKQLVDFIGSRHQNAQVELLMHDCGIKRGDCATEEHLKGKMETLEEVMMKLGVRPKEVDMDE